jgi:hypothetical protein
MYHYKNRILNLNVPLLSTQFNRCPVFCRSQSFPAKKRHLDIRQGGLYRRGYAVHSSQNFNELRAVLQKEDMYRIY